MKGFSEYQGLPTEFWSLVKIVSELLGYSVRGIDRVSYYSCEEIERCCRENQFSVSIQEIEMIADYSKRRADLLNNTVKENLMTVEQAEIEFNKLFRLGAYYCKLPLNKQSGLMKKSNYYTGIINMLAENTLKEEIGEPGRHFDEDPRGLLCFRDKANRVVGASSRRFDGAFPSICNPFSVWEIKEY